MSILKCHNRRCTMGTQGVDQEDLVPPLGTYGGYQGGFSKVKITHSLAFSPKSLLKAAPDSKKINRNAIWELLENPGTCYV